jgi:putative endonuclease
MYFVYVLKSVKDSKLYYGFTENLEKRLSQHNAGLVTSTKSRRPFILIYSEKVDSLENARRKEKYFKSGFGRKYLKNKLRASSSNG